MLLLVRRNIQRHWSFGQWDALRWQGEHLWRLLRRDRSWLVEVYFRVHSDPGGRPTEDPSQWWVLPNRKAANSFAEEARIALTANGPLGLRDLWKNSGYASTD